MNLALVCASAPALKVFFGAYVVAPITKFSNTRTATLNQYELTNSFVSTRAGLSTAAAGKRDTTLSPYKQTFDKNDIMVQTRVSVSHDENNGKGPESSFFHY